MNVLRILLGLLLCICGSTIVAATGNPKAIFGLILVGIAAPLYFLN